MQRGHDPLTSMLLVVAGGVLTGIFAFPMKRLTEWQWENIWFAYSCFGFVLVPLLVVGATVSHMGAVYHSVTSGCLLAVLGSGYAWGWGSALFGVGIKRLGMGLGFSLILGITTVLGALAPFLLIHGAGNLHLHWLISGLLLLVVGLAFCGRAGSLRHQTALEGGYVSGLIICVLAGTLSAVFNFGTAAAGPIQQAALVKGTAGWAAANAFWPIMLFGGFLGNATYCSILFVRHGSLRNFWTTGTRGWSTCFIMGTVWIAGVLLYGLGSFRMGALGTVLGWPFFTSLMVLSAYVLGLFTGEWRGASLRSRVWMNAGVAIITASLFFVARGQ